MTRPRTKAETKKFPFAFTKNGRTGKIYRLGNGTFKTYFQFAGKMRQNTHGSFEAAFGYLDSEFKKVDADTANALSFHPLNGSVKMYSELECLLRKEVGGASLQEAVQFFLAHAKSKRFEPKPFAECVDSFLEHQAANNVKAISVKTFKKHLRRFQKEFATRKIHDITALEISNWLNTRKEERTGNPWTPNTRTKVRGSLVTLSIYAQKTLKAIPDFGDTEFQNVRAPNQEERAEVEIYSPCELRKLLEAAFENDIDLIPALVVGNFLGLRPYEFHAEGLERPSLAWEAFNWEDKHLHFKGQKIRSKATREIPLQPATLAWLEPFRNQKGLIWKKVKVYDYRMAQLREKADVKGIRDGYRHSYASYRIRQLKGKGTKLRPKWATVLQNCGLRVIAGA